MKEIIERAGTPDIACSDLLGRRRMGTKSCDDRLQLPLRTVNNPESKLGEMKSYPGVISVVIDALKKKGMRFEEVSLKNGDITYNNKNIVVFRGDAAKVLHRAFHGVPCGMTTHHAGENLSLCANGSGFGRLDVSNLAADVIHKSKKRSRPNVES